MAEIIYSLSPIITAMWIIVFLAMTIDLISGVRKAKELDEIRTSIGLRRTVSKAILYYSLLAFGLLFDSLIIMCVKHFEIDAHYIFPFVSLIMTAFLVFIEWRSFFEKADIKAKKKMKAGASEIAYFLSEHKELLPKAIELLKDKKDDNGTDTTTNS